MWKYINDRWKARRKKIHPTRARESWTPTQLADFFSMSLVRFILSIYLFWLGLSEKKHQQLTLQKEVCTSNCKYWTIRLVEHVKLLKLCVSVSTRCWFCCCFIGLSTMLVGFFLLCSTRLCSFFFSFRLSAFTHRFAVAQNLKKKNVAMRAANST